MIYTVIESPFAAANEEDRARNIRYARQAVADSLDRGEAPLAGHLLYTQVLDDDDPPDRAIGITAHLAWIARADILAVYTDLGISQGMQAGIDLAEEFADLGLVVEYRKIDGVGQ